MSESERVASSEVGPVGDLIGDCGSGIFAIPILNWPMKSDEA